MLAPPTRHELQVCTRGIGGLFLTCFAPQNLTTFNPACYIEVFLLQSHPPRSTPPAHVGSASLACSSAEEQWRALLLLVLDPADIDVILLILITGTHPLVSRRSSPATHTPTTQAAAAAAAPGGAFARVAPTRRSSSNWATALEWQLCGYLAAHPLVIAVRAAQRGRRSSNLTSKWLPSQPAKWSAQQPGWPCAPPMQLMKASTRVRA